MTDIDFSTLKVAAILNTASGNCDASAGEKVAALLAEAHITEPTIWCGGPDVVDAAFKEVAAHKPDVLIVLGGDGTIRNGAEFCTSEGPLLIALPGGTMNMLPKALYGERSWEEALRDTLAAPRVKSVSCGSATGRQFFIAAIVGGPALWAKAREALREGDISAAVDKGVDALQNMFATKLTYSFAEDAQGEAEAIAVICPLISDAMADSERSLEAAVLTEGSAGAVLGLASSSAFGTWRDDEHVSIIKTQQVEISADGDLPLILDGETMRLGKSVKITFIAESFKALVPAV